MIKKKEVSVYVCDICGEECLQHVCMFCGRDICNEHNCVFELRIRHENLNEIRPVVCEDCAGGATLIDFLEKVSEMVKVEE